ncbi:MAG TPA: amino acid deaminase [Oleiagrimonas sp.]|nr:amino acid deaminase [Oleiagrimonas sp.]
MQTNTSIEQKGSLQFGRSLLTDISLPAAVISEPALANNIAWMQRFAEQRGSHLAPHGKTTMTPAIFRRQIAAGAWGITLATATQCAAAFEHGVARLLMANQLVGEPNMAIVGSLIERGADFYCTVDSVANVKALNTYFARRGLVLQVLIELGVPGGRCGLRNAAELDSLVAAIAECANISLRGIEGYEGLIHGDDEVEAVRAYGRRLVEATSTLKKAGAIDGKAIVTASGSKWFDLIAEAFEDAGLDGDIQPLMRPGCYVAHDHRLYRQAMEDVQARHPDLQGSLEAALTVFAHVQSLPEPGLAVVAMGKRDIAADPDLPIPLTVYRAGQAPRDAAGMTTTKIMDQHTMLELTPGADIEVGDIIAFGASHPCLTFDKWRQVLLVDAQLQVREIMPTYF